MTDSDKTTSLDDLRNRIDQLDTEILKKLNERARCALDVASPAHPESLALTIFDLYLLLSTKTCQHEDRHHRIPRRLCRCLRPCSGEGFRHFVGCLRR